MSEWKEKRIEEIVLSANTGLDAIKRAPIVERNTGIKCLRIQDVSQSKSFNNWGFTEVEKRNFEKFQLKRNDIIIARTGATIGVNLLIKEDLKAVFNNGLIRVRANETLCDPVFLYYNFRTSNYYGYIESISGGTSTQPNMQINALLRYEILLPTLSEQRAIASTFKSIDDKIDLLKRQNTTVENLAEVLFRQWFVEEVKEEWETDILGNLFDIGIGRTPPRKEHQWFSKNPSDIMWVSIKDMGISGVYLSRVSEYLTHEAVEKFSIPIIPEDTVMLSFKMTIGRLAITTEKMLSNEAIAHFKVKGDSNLYSEFLYLYLKTYQWEQLGSTSSIVDAINSQMIKEMEIAIPDKKKLNDFKELILPYFAKIKSNQKQINTLAILRDSLLPKLMNGEVTINTN
jgi:type I restriction enzyme S subunit